MELVIQAGLPFITLTVAYRGASLDIPDVLLDTGSAGTLLSADLMARIGIVPEPSDSLHTVRGVGGTEVVFPRTVDYLQLDNRQVSDFLVEIGAVDYGFPLNGILGMDYLTQIGAIINLRRREITFAP